MTAVTTRKQRIQHAVQELEDTIRHAYPDAEFAVTHGWDDPSETWLWVAVDLDDPSDVHDLVLDRLVDMHIDELPVHVLPTNRLPEHLQKPGRQPTDARAESLAPRPRRAKHPREAERSV
ncbi:MAG TPA: hypothetical protein VKV26_17685 [Dehalococcoidia bacterium]|nr:hypothetical protein [Dehalococcoidia bacterium]